MLTRELLFDMIRKSRLVNDPPAPDDEVEDFGVFSVAQLAVLINRHFEKKEAS